MRLRNRVANILRVIVLNLLILELLSFLSVHALGILRPNRRVDLFIDEQLAGVTNQSIADYLSGNYDAELGWNLEPSSTFTERNSAGVTWTTNRDEMGARVSCLSAGDDIFATTYGDSFVHGDEVDDHETWQCALERSIQKRVANFGVGAYGVDQAILKAKRHWREGLVAPYTVLAVYADDLNRVFSQYRPFLNSATGGKLSFKPSVRYVNGTVSLLGNPLPPDVATKDEIRRLALSVADTDYWAQVGRVFPRFPYTLQIARTALYSTRQSAAYGNDLWDSPMGRETMMYLIRDFVAGARQYGTKPVLLLIPDIRSWKDGRKPAEYEGFVQQNLAAIESELTIVDIATVSFDEQRFSILPFEGHASVYGNQVIADALAPYLDPTVIPRR